MNKIIATLILSTCISLSLKAQYTPLFKYEIAPWAFENIFLDHVKDNRSTVITVGSGQYVGQADATYSLYGYGQFISNNGDIIIGKFRKGELLQGISLGSNNVTVGNKDFHCSYNLSSGKMEYVYNRGTKEISENEDMSDYTFMSQTFANGDKYVGELYKGKRHGLGIYYYSDGSLWYGSFINDLRNGFGAWFKTSNDMVIGQWDSEEERRRVYIPLR